VLRRLSAEKAPWLFEKNLQVLLSALSEGKEEARVVGGAIRNTLLGEPIRDIDIATTTLPEITIARARRFGFNILPTGIDFGTVTVGTNEGRGYEITTLRADLETDGRYARVCFGRNWKTDAKRRDFTINALYVDKDGIIYDYVAGLQDIEDHVLRFIGSAEERIREDCLRILRFFRFYAWIGDSHCPDSQEIKAIARLKDSLYQLSAERTWSELRKLLAAPDPLHSLLWMHNIGILAIVLPEIEKQWMESIHALIETEKSLAWQADPLLRLATLVPSDTVRIKALANRLKFSNAEKNRLIQLSVSNLIATDFSEIQLKKCIYYEGRQPVLDRLRLSIANAYATTLRDNCIFTGAGNYVSLEKLARNWKIPTFPISGRDMMTMGFNQGPGIGKMLNILEDMWIKSMFQWNKNSLLAHFEEEYKTPGRALVQEEHRCNEMNGFLRSSSTK